MSSKPDISRVALLHHESQRDVDADLWDTVNDKNLADWETKWTPELHKLIESFRSQDVGRQLWPQNRPWDWRATAESIQNRLDGQCFSIVCDGMTQAMMITTLTHRAKLEGQRNDHLVYVEFVEAAPWNRQQIVSRSPRYSGCGSILVGAAIEYSKLEGFKGRIGLHSLPQANNFYANKIGMSDLGQDADCKSLRYFEMSPEQAQAFMINGRRK